MDTAKWIAWLRTQKNPEKIPDMERYMRNQFSFLGLQAVERRQLARDELNRQMQALRARAKLTGTDESVLDSDWLLTLWAQPEREFQLIGLDYLKRAEAYLREADFSLLQELILSKSWWDTVDFLAKNVGALVLRVPSLKQEMQAWSLEENIWLRRVSILHQLPYKKQTDTSLLTEVIVNNFEIDEFFIEKAIGWALREYAKTDEQWVRSFVSLYADDLSALSIREATKNLK